MIFDILAVLEQELKELGAIIVGHRSDVVNDYLIRLVFHIRHTVRIVICHYEIDVVLIYG